MLERARHARLLRILLVYLGASFAVLEAIDLLGDKLGLPAWVFSGAVVLLLIGLPIIIATSLIQASGPVAVDSAVGVSSGQRPQATRRLFTWRNAITGGVVAFALWGAAVAGWMLFGPDAGAASGGETEISSLAVLPFADMSPDGSAEYLGDGVAETLIDALTKVEGLRVAARTSAFSFKGKNEDIRTIGEQLNVNAVLEGSVQTAGNRVRITAQLIEVEDGFHLWSQVYESELEDVFAVQDEVARSVVSALELTLAGDSGQTIVESGTESLEAYDYYLLGLHHWHNRTPNDIGKAIDYFEQAIEADSQYARAWSGLASSHLLSIPGQYRVPGVTWAAGLIRSERAARRALAQNEQLAEAHTVLGFIHSHRWEWEEAEREYRRSIRLDPHYATAHQWYAAYLAGMGRTPEAVAEIRRAHELDPLSLIVNVWLALVLEAAGELTEAAAAYERTLELYPNHSRPHRDAFLFFASRGDFERAAIHIRRYVEIAEGDGVLAGRLANGIRSPVERSKTIFEIIDRMPGEFGDVRRLDLLTLASKPEQALTELEAHTAVADSGWIAEALGVYVRNPELRADPRFQAALRHMGLR
jgi:TolB-like protein/tetratricopeptide (TPR) repeat protein